MGELQVIQGWQLKWHAKSRILFKGRLFMGPSDHSTTVIIISVFIALSYLYWISFYSLIKKANALHIFYFELFLGFICSYNFLKCTFSDPGIILRKQNYEQLHAEREEKYKKERAEREKKELEIRLAMQ